MSERKCIYLIGPYVDGSVEETLGSMRIAREESLALMMKGYAPYSRWFLAPLLLHDDEAGEDLEEVTNAWMAKADAAMALSGWEDCDESRAEIGVLEELGVMVFDTFESLEKAHMQGDF